MSVMLSEIRAQPDVVRRIIDTEFHRVDSLAQEIARRKIAFVYIAARGTSDNAAVYAKYLLEIQHGLPVALAAPSVFTLYDTVPHMDRSALVLGISQSGAGQDVIEVIRRAREAGALTAAITNEPESPLAAAAEFPLFIGAGPEVAVSATKTYTGSLAVLAMLSTALDETHPERLEHLRRAADSIEKTLALDEAVQSLVENYKDMNHCVVLGRGYSHSTAAEAALKLTEMSYVSAMAYSAADFQHGPIAQVDAGFPCLLFAPDGKSFASMLSLAEKLRAQHPALICFAHNPAILAGSETAVRIPASVPEWVSPLVYIAAAQLFAHWLCVAKGLDPDEVRGMKKVTSTV
jgi:glucosamine--fructose-6-phosphate aminotransferase (isomerizing)